MGLALLCASLGANWWLGSMAFRNFAAIGDVRLDPIGLKFYETDRAHPPAAGEHLPSVVFFGDSRAVMWPSPSVPGYHVVNRGIGQQTTAQMLLRFDADVAPLHPAVVVVEGGINDLKTLSEAPGRRAQIVGDCEANIARIVDKSRGLGATVVLLGVIGLGDLPLWLRPLWSQEVAKAVQEVNARLPQLASEKVLFLDANRVLTDARGTVRSDYQWGYLHLSNAGYDALDHELVPLLSSLPR